MKVTPVVSGSPLYSAVRLILDELELNIMAWPVQTGPPRDACCPMVVVAAAAMMAVEVPTGTESYAEAGSCGMGTGTGLGAPCHRSLVRNCNYNVGK